MDFEKYYIFLLKIIFELLTNHYFNFHNLDNYFNNEIENYINNESHHFSQH